MYAVVEFDIFRERGVLLSTYRLVAEVRDRRTPTCDIAMSCRVVLLDADTSRDVINSVGDLISSALSDFDVQYQHTIYSTTSDRYGVDRVSKRSFILSRLSPILKDCALTLSHAVRT